MKDLIVLKLGTSTITDKSGELNKKILNDICNQIVLLQKKYRLILVSSGAVGCGKNFIKNFSNKLNNKKAAAAIGNPILIGKYAKILSKNNISVAQILVERGDFSHRNKFLRIRETCEKLWENDVLPIFNENDVSADFELTFSDNDELATLISVGFSAKKLLLGTSVEGLLDKEKKLVPKIKNFNEEVFGLAHRKKSEAGLGGMISKLNCANLATKLGTLVQIFDARIPNNIINAVEEKTGTICPAKICEISAHNKWMASGSLTVAKVFVDEGAKKALENKKSLLYVGVKKIVGEFKKGEIFEIHEMNKVGIFAVAQSKIDSKELPLIKNKKGIYIARVDEIVIL